MPGVEVFGHVDRRAYNPGRDVARLLYNTSATAIGDCATVNGMPGLVRDKLEVTQDEMKQVVDAFLCLLKRLFDVEQPMLTLGQAFQLSGMKACRQEAQAILFLRLGQLYFSHAYVGVLDLQSTDEAIVNERDILEKTQEAMRAFTKTNWLSRLVGRLKWWA